MSGHNALHQLNQYAVLSGPNGIMLAFGDTVPTDGTPGYAKSCQFHDYTGASEAALLYLNAGTNTSCNFVAVTGVASP